MAFVKEIRTNHNGKDHELAIVFSNNRFQRILIRGCDEQKEIARSLRTLADNIERDELLIKAI